jgi:hypothetical protein
MAWSMASPFMSHACSWWHSVSHVKYLFFYFVTLYWLLLFQEENLLMSLKPLTVWWLDTRAWERWGRGEGCMPKMSHTSSICVSFFPWWMFIDGCLHIKNLSTSLKHHKSSIFFVLHDGFLLIGCHHVRNLWSLKTTQGRWSLENQTSRSCPKNGPPSIHREDDH